MKQIYLNIILILICSQACTFLFAQKEASVWYFGDRAGLDFNSASPKADTLSKVNTIEGTSVICDKNTGALLFYTDGISVWDKNQNVMPNGNGLAGNSSSTQSAIIIEQPEKDSIYYIFTTTQLGQSPGACYSIVDLTLNNGLGDVIAKNEILHSSTCEKVTAAKHCNGKDYWIVFHEWISDLFYVYPLTASGVGNAITSGTGMTVTGSVSKTRGEMKLSTDCRKLAIANDNLGAQLFDFDNSSGIISNPLDLNVSPRTYGVCFSPDNSRLYITTGWTEKDIYQFDLTSSNIVSTQTLVGTTSASYIGSLQNAPDGKIYAATYGASSIGVINNPNASGLACNYVDTAISLDGRICKWGLPNFPQNFFDASITQLSLSYSIDSCSNKGLEVSFSANYISSFDSLLITYGDGSFSNDLNASHTYTVNGTYLAALSIYNGCKILYDTATINIQITAPLNIGNDTLICSGSQLTLDASSVSGTYTWSTGATTSSILLSSANTYWVMVNSGNCILSDTLTVGMNQLNAGFTFQMSCSNDTIRFLDTTSSSIISWDWDFGDGISDSISNPEHVYATNGNYQASLSVTSAEGCSETVIKNIKASSSPLVAFTTDTVCLGDTTFFTDASKASVGKINSWLWNFGDGSSSTDQHPKYVYKDAGSFNVSLTISTDSGCIATGMQLVKVNGKPSAGFNLMAEMFCEKENITLVNTSKIPTGSNIKDYIWDFGNGITSRQKNPVFNYSNNGNYNINLQVISNLGCMDTASKKVQVNPAPLANASILDACMFDSIQFNDQSLISSGGIAAWSWSFGDNTTSYMANPIHVYESDSSFNVSLIVTSLLGCKDTANMIVNVYEKPEVNFIASLACVGQEVEFVNNTNVKGANLSWDWSFGNGKSSFDKNPSSIYLSAANYTVQLIATNGVCSDSLEQIVTVNPTPMASFTYEESYECTSQTIVFENNSSINTSSIASWNWEFGDGGSSSLENPTHTFTTEGNHIAILTVSSSEGCQMSYESAIETEFSALNVDFYLSTTETTLLNSIEFTDNSSNAQSLVWYMGDGTQINNETQFSHLYSGIGVYTVTLVASSASGCVDSSSQLITINGDQTLYIPTAFTPNGDGTNDLFTAFGMGVEQFVMRIFDRWGNEVFATDNMVSGWNGTISGENAMQGMYVYEIAIKDANGKEKQLQGGVNLIR